MPNTNPITERLDRLYDQWFDFVDDAPARVLRWCVRSDEERMIETFVGVENSEGGRLPALFVRLVVPFDAPHTYAFALWRELHAQVERESEQDESLRGFVAPRPRTDHHGIASLAELAGALVDHVRARGVELEHVALVILPSAVEDASGWASFVGRLATMLTRSDVRAIVTDRRAGLVLEPAGATAGPRLHTAVAELDMPGALLAISARAGDLDAPTGRFRQAYTQMLLAVSEHDMDRAQHRGAEAMTIADAQGWWHLVVAVRFCIGTGFLDARRAPEAVKWFRRAEEPLDATRPTTGAADDAALAGSLRLKCRLGLGAACYFASAFDRAAEVYASAALIAKELGDGLAELDCRRLQSHCHERDGRLDEAWNAGLDGLGVGARLPEDERRMSTLPHLGQALLALTRRSSLSHGRAAIEAQMRRLLGDRWESQRRATGS